MEKSFRYLFIRFKDFSSENALENESTLKGVSHCLIYYSKTKLPKKKVNPKPENENPPLRPQQHYTDDDMTVRARSSVDHFGGEMIDQFPCPFNYFWEEDLKQYELFIVFVLKVPKKYKRQILRGKGTQR